MNFLEPIEDLFRSWEDEKITQSDVTFFSIHPRSYPNVQWSKSNDTDDDADTETRSSSSSSSASSPPETLAPRKKTWKAISFSPKVRFIVKECHGKTSFGIQVLERGLVQVNGQTVPEKKMFPIFTGDVFSFRNAVKWFTFVFFKRGASVKFAQFMAKCLYIQTHRSSQMFVITDQNFQSGGFGKVHLGKCLATGERVVVKSTTMEPKPGSFHEMKADARFLFDLQGHPNICKLFFVECYNDGGFLTYMEHFGTDLLEVMKKREGKELGTARVKKILIQLLSVLMHIHSMGKAHMDLKLENILIDEKTDVIKLIDFGIARDEEFAVEFVGTSPFAAPEIVKMSGEPYLTQKADVWSLGVVLYCMFHGQFPYESGAPLEHVVLFPAIVQRSSCIPREAKDFILKTCVLDFEKRPIVEELICDPWVCEDFLLYHSKCT